MQGEGNFGCKNDPATKYVQIYYYDQIYDFKVAMQLMKRL